MFRIIEKKTVAPDIFLMKVYAPRVAKFAQPGQFVIVISDPKGERIPLTVCDYNRKEGWVVIVVQVVGASTRRMDLLKAGDLFSGFAGPLGQPSEFVSHDLAELKNKKFIFVAGGLGAAPVFPQIKWLFEKGIRPDLIIGSRSAEQLILLDDLKKMTERLYVVTNDGSEGEKGFVTDILHRLLENDKKYYDECITIGPMVMMKAVTELTRPYSLKTIVSLNSMMIDGTGMCGACRVTVGGKTRFTCVDGPEFDGHLVDFDEAIRRQGMYRHEEKESAHICNLEKAVDESVKMNSDESGK